MLNSNSSCMSCSPKQEVPLEMGKLAKRAHERLQVRYDFAKCSVVVDSWRSLLFLFCLAAERDLEHEVNELQEQLLPSPVSEQVHRRGINIRHIGLLRSHIKRNSHARLTMLVELVARTLKNILRDWLRQGTNCIPAYIFLSATYRVTHALFLVGSHARVYHARALSILHSQPALRRC